MDKALAYSVLITWVDAGDNSDRKKWCYNKMLNLLLKDERTTIKFLKAQRDDTYLELLSETLPELAYQFNSWIFIREMKRIAEYHVGEKWQQNLELATTKVKRPPNAGNE